MPAISCSIEDEERITVQRCSDRDHTLPGKLCITNLPSGKKDGRQRPVINLRALNMFVISGLPGKDNITADCELRSTRDRCDWMLNPQVFQKIQRQMGPLQIDLFASRLTKQLPDFYSWRPDPEAIVTDAFNQDWEGLPTPRGA